MRRVCMVLGAWMLGLLICSAQDAATPSTAGKDPDVTENVTALEKTVADQDKATSQRLDKLEKRVNQLVERMGGNGATLNLATVDRKLSELEKRVTKIERDIDQLKSRVSRVESRH